MSTDDELSPQSFVHQWLGFSPSICTSNPTYIYPSSSATSISMSVFLDTGFIGYVKPLHIFASWLGEWLAATKRKTIWPKPNRQWIEVQDKSGSLYLEWSNRPGPSWTGYLSYLYNIWPLWEMPPNAKYILCRLPAFDLLFTLQPAV